jgi:hypothetical protein
MNPRMVLAGLVKFVAVVVAAGIVGAGLGIGLAEVTGSDAPGTAVATPTTATAPTPVSPGNLTPRVQIRSAVLYPARTARGRARRLARVVVPVRVVSRAATTIAAAVPSLLVGARTVRSDPRAADAAGNLLEPLKPAASATGELRFEIAGAVTQALSRRPRARMRIAGRVVGVHIRISRTPARSGE